MAKHSGDGIFCLEGEWSADLRERVSVRPILELLDHLGVAGYIHRDVATREELVHYVDKWRQKRYASYKVLFLAMHGDAESLHLGRDDLTLGELGGVLEGACQGKVVYFGSCLTLKASEKSLMEFVRRTGARAVVGYRKSVPWLESAAFEVLLLDRLALGLRSDAVFNRLAKEHGLFAKSLGLVVATRSKVRKVPLRDRSSAGEGE